MHMSKLAYVHYIKLKSRYNLALNDISTDCLNISCPKGSFKIFIHIPHLFDLRGKSREKVK